MVERTKQINRRVSQNKPKEQPVKKRITKDEPQEQQNNTHPVSGDKRKEMASSTSQGAQKQSTTNLAPPPKEAPNEPSQESPQQMEMKSQQQLESQSNNTTQQQQQQTEKSNLSRSPHEPPQKKVKPNETEETATKTQTQKQPQEQDQKQSEKQKETRTSEQQKETKEESKNIIGSNISKDVLDQICNIQDTNQMRQLVEKYGTPLEQYKVGTKITVNSKMQSNYSYELKEPVGKNFAQEFNPQYTPAEILKMGAFEGKYMNDCILEYPKEWYLEALNENKLSPGVPNPKLNKFGVKSRLPLSVWKTNGWIYGNDRRGFFEWYCRYYLGRREPDVDQQQIKLWLDFENHEAKILEKSEEGKELQLKMKQSLVQWAKKYE